MNGLRLGTPEIVRRGVTTDHAPELAGCTPAEARGLRHGGQAMGVVIRSAVRAGG